MTILIDLNSRATRLVLLATLFFSFAANSELQPLSLEEVVSLKVVTEARMNPDGDRVAYLLSVPREIFKDKDGRSNRELRVVDFDGHSRAYVSGEFDISAMAWSADGDSIFFVAKRDSKADFNSLFEIGLDGGEAVKTFTHVNSIGRIHPSPDGSTIAFIASDAPPADKKALEEKGFKALVYEESVPVKKVWLLDLETKETRAHDLPGSASTFTWAPDGDRYAVALAPTPLVDDSYTSRDIHVVNTTDGKVVIKMGSVGKLGTFEFSPDGEQIAYVGSVDINDPSEGRLFVASASGGQRQGLVPEYPGHVADFGWRDDTTIRWMGSRGVWTEWSIAGTRSTYSEQPAPTSGPIIRSIDARPGLSFAAAVADSPLHPREVYLLGDDAEPKRLTDSNPILKERLLSKQEPITYKARDGLELEAILIHPAEKQRGGNPLVIVVHGGPEAHQSNGWMTAYSRPGQVLAAEGYAVVYPNYRGSTGRGVYFSKLGQNDYAEEEFNDIVDAKRHLVAEGLVDGDRVGITGGSYGGYASMWSASALSEEYAAAVASVGISNQVSKFGTGDIPYEMFNVHSRAWPWEDWMWMLKRSPIYHADKTKTPLLIMHGDKDPRVHPSQSLEMYRHVKLRTDTPVRLVFYPGEGHGNRNAAARYDYALRFKRWMDHYLKGPGGEPPPYEIDHASRLSESDEAE